MSRKQKTVCWGSPEYLVEKFDTIDHAVRISPRTKAATTIRRLVKSVSTPKDKMLVYGGNVYRCNGMFDETPSGCVIAQITFGLNGPGKQSDYLAALKRLTDTGRFFIFDCNIDALDDVYDVLVTFKE